MSFIGFKVPPPPPKYFYRLCLFTLLLYSRRRYCQQWFFFSRFCFDRWWFTALFNTVLFSFWVGVCFLFAFFFQHHLFIFSNFVSRDCCLLKLLILLGDFCQIFFKTFVFLGQFIVALFGTQKNFFGISYLLVSNFNSFSILSRLFSKSPNKKFICSSFIYCWFL